MSRTMASKIPRIFFNEISEGKMVEITLKAIKKILSGKIT